MIHVISCHVLNGRMQSGQGECDKTNFLQSYGIDGKYHQKIPTEGT